MPDNVRANLMPQQDVTPESNKLSWSRQKESTSSEPEGLTFSHYKAGALDPIINAFDARLRGIPYQHGFSPKHWQEITDVKILKKSGVYNIEKMRTITQMDAAFNMNNKQLGRDLLRQAETHQNLANEQYGSRHHHRSSTAATNKVLMMDLLRLKQQAGALCSNDAKSCYDRIVHSVVALALRQQGAPMGPVESMLKTLQNAKHKIRTAFGVLTQHYGGDRATPLQGLDQGNRMAPTGWGVISTPLINMMKTAGFGMETLSCLSRQLLSIVCYAFIDDTDLIHTGRSVDTKAEDVLPEMQQFVEHWEGGLRATGGALRVDKSFWYLVDFPWVNNKWHYRSKEQMPGNISV
jgi:Reverse transcriptase (RNA-dependent DNA polymerase)